MLQTQLEAYFKPFRQHIIGIDQSFSGPYGEKRIAYADWTASGRLYSPIEQRMSGTFGPFVANTHSESNTTGTTMTHAYHLAQLRIKQHVNADANDVIIMAGAGMTTVVNKFQRILGLRLVEQLLPYLNLPNHKRPVVFVTHMEHHSNQTSWLETIADVEVLEPNALGLVCPDNLRQRLRQFDDRPLKIGAFTSCSNVTGIETPYHELAAIMHEQGGLCFVDFAASAPYVDINMHPADPAQKLDAIYFSPHKFLGGPGSPGVLVFDSQLYHNRVPDQPGGGTVNWTNPWHGHSFVDNIEAREDGGTPGFLQAIRAALAIELKNNMGVPNIRAREEHLMQILFREMRSIPSMNILAGHIEQRLGILSFYIDAVHYNLIVKLLNDRFGVQVRGGCSCAGTYGHYLLHVDPNHSKRITDQINAGNLSEKPGWVRMSIHPTTTDDEAHFFAYAVRESVLHLDQWSQDYVYSPETNEYYHRNNDEHDRNKQMSAIQQWFTL
jgi:selenocysteine lyase/cysteine desulfurase